MFLFLAPPAQAGVRGCVNLFSPLGETEGSKTLTHPSIPAQAGKHCLRLSREGLFISFDSERNEAKKAAGYATKLLRSVDG